MKSMRPDLRQPRPEDAERVFKGIVFDVYQWQQSMFDGSKRTFEQIARPDTADIISITPEGKILILNEEQPGDTPSVNFPGGRVDPGEAPEEAVVRELKEETGYEVESLKLWLVRQPYVKIDWMIYTFIGHGAKKVADVKFDAGERMQIKEVNFDEFLKIAREDDRFLHTDIALLAYKAAFDPAYYAELKKLFGL